MPYPARLIADSDLSSTPAPLAGAITLELKTPANVVTQGLSPITFESSYTFDEQFDTVDYILSCDELPDVMTYNSYLEENNNLTTVWVFIKLEGRTVKLTAIFDSTDGGTFEPSRTFRATVIPTKSPFSAS